MSYGEPLRHFAECASTNDIALEWALDAVSPAPDGGLVTTDLQTRGRGRRGRAWISGAGDDVLMSMVLRGTGGREDVWQVAFVCALAVADVLAGLGIEGRIKWPNDILIDGNKVGGILVEAPTPRSEGWLAIAGIGLNVNRDDFGDPGQYLVPPTSLFLSTGQRYSVGELAASIAHSIESRESARRDGGWPVLVEEMRNRLANGIVLTSGGVEGRLRGMGMDGQVIVELEGGTFGEWRTVDYEAGQNSV